MTIKHLVISGGGPIGFQYLGALQYLQEQEFWKIQDIQSIYATSVGSLIAVLLSLQYDWPTIQEYFIQRPWNELFKLNGKQIVEAYYSKGLYDKKIIDSCLKPLLEAKDLSLEITLKEFYEYSSIELHLYTFELNSFTTVELNHRLFPDILLTKAISMSSAIPGLFMPIFSDNGTECYIDGGVMSNYPLSFCLENGCVKEEILGLNYSIEGTNDDGNCLKEKNITPDSSIVEFILRFSTNAMNFISESISSKETIPSQIICLIEESPISLNYIKKTIQSKELRAESIEQGRSIAQKMLEL